MNCFGSHSIWRSGFGPFWQTTLRLSNGHGNIPGDTEMMSAYSDDKSKKLRSKTHPLSRGTRSI